MIVKIFRKLLDCFILQTFLAKIADLLFPKNSSLYLFGSFRGLVFEDNSCYLFDYICGQETDINAVWFSRSKELTKNIQSEYGEDRAVYAYSLKGLLTLLQAKVIIVSYTLTHDIPLSFMISKRKIVINLWHGISMKGLFLTDSAWPERFKKRYLKKISPRYTAYVASSEIERLALSACFGVPPDKIPITGYPRNDYLLKYNNGQLRKKKVSDFLSDNIGRVDKVVLYAPTKREDHLPKTFPFDDFDLKEFCGFLEKNHMLILLRAHKGNFSYDTYTAPLDFKEFAGHNRILAFNADKVQNVSDILCDVDILITDYSGIYFDFLLLNRPIVFVPYDLDEYKKSPGLLFDYDLITAGPKVDSMRKLVKHLSYCSGNTRIDEGKRLYLRDMFHKFQDGGACERIMDYIRTTLQK